MLRPELQLALTLGHVKSTLIKRIGRRSTGASWAHLTHDWTNTFRPCCRN